MIKLMQDEPGALYWLNRVIGTAGFDDLVAEGRAVW